VLSYASGDRGVVAAGSARAVAAGVSILQGGGNAADAAVATILAMAVTDYGRFAIGGEVPFMIRDAARDEVKVLCGLGRAPLDEDTIRRFMADGIPRKGDIKATPVPGAVGLCLTALRLHGSMSFERVARPVLSLLAEAREAWYLPLAKTFRRLIDAERSQATDREAGLEEAEHRFYRGDVAKELAAWIRMKGGVLEASDLEAHATRVEDPVCVEYRGHSIYKCGPWTQGPCLCQALRLIDGFDLEAMGHLTPDYVHLLTETLKLAMADRDEHYGDPDFVDVPLEELFGDDYTDLRRKLIDIARASDEFRPGDPRRMRAIKRGTPMDPGPGGTTTCVVADRMGNVVAATPSCNPPYAVCDSLGISLGNRLRSLNTAEGHANCIRPGKRPRITLTPTIARASDGRIIAVSVAGGDRQDQTTLNCLLNCLDFAMPPREAVVAPRFHTRHHQNSFDPNSDRAQAVTGRRQLVVGAGMTEEVVSELGRRGHEVVRAKAPVADPVMLVFDPRTGMAHAAGDPDSGRHASAVE